LEDQYKVKMKALIGVTDEVIVAHLNILAQGYLDDFDEGLDELSTDEEGGLGHYPVEYQTGSPVAYLGKGTTHVVLGYVVGVHPKDYPYYTVNLEGLGEKQTVGRNMFPISDGPPGVPKRVNPDPTRVMSHKLEQENWPAILNRCI
jgi:hypothetical protein